MILRRGAVRAATIGCVAAAGVVGFAPSAFADGGSDRLVAEYADATWTPNSYTVRIAPGEERTGGRTTDFIEASIDGAQCFRSSNTRSYLVTADLETAQSGRLDGIKVDARGGDADVNRNQRFNGTLVIQTANPDCSVPSGAPYVINNPTLRLDADWNRKPGARPVEYSGADCGGNGQCYYIDAVATGKVSIPGFREASFDLGQSDSAFLFRGAYPG